MGRRNGPSTADFPVGMTVRVKDRVFLEMFWKEWDRNDPLDSSQLDFGGRTTTVKSVSHEVHGDEMYLLTDCPGTWHEICLEPAGVHKAEVPAAAASRRPQNQRMLQAIFVTALVCISGQVLSKTVPELANADGYHSVLSVLFGLFVLVTSLASWAGSIYFWFIARSLGRARLAEVFLLAVFGALIGSFYVLLKSKIVGVWNESEVSTRRPIQRSALEGRFVGSWAVEASVVNLGVIVVLTLWRLVAGYGQWIQVGNADGQIQAGGLFSVVLVTVVLANLPAWALSQFAVQILLRQWLTSEGVLNVSFLLFWAAAACVQWYVIHTLVARWARKTAEESEPA